VKNKIRRGMWVHPVICGRRNDGLLGAVFEDLRRDEAKFLNYFRISADS
jgi:hypothetical protein